MKTSKIKFVIFAVIIAAAVVSGIFIVNNNNNSKFQQQLKLGNEALLNMDYEAAVTAFANAIGLNPKDVQAYLGITKAYVAMDDFKNACEYLSQGRVEIPEPSILTMLDFLTAEDFVSLGNEFLAQGNQDSAKDAFEEALKKDPANEEAQKGMEDAETLPDSENSQDGNSSQDDATSGDNAQGNDVLPDQEANTASPEDTVMEDESTDDYIITGELQVLDADGNRFQLPNGKEWVNAWFGTENFESSIFDMDGNEYKSYEGRLLFSCPDGDIVSFYIAPNYVTLQQSPLITVYYTNTNYPDNTIVLMEYSDLTVDMIYPGGYEDNTLGNRNCYYIANGTTIEYAY